MGSVGDKTIYAIQHNETKRIYVGCSLHFEKRIREHMSHLRNNKHTNAELQKDYNLYGENFSYFVLERNVHFLRCFDREKEWMSILKSNLIETGYNLMTAERPITLNDFKKQNILIGSKKRKSKFFEVPVTEFIE